MNEKEFDLSGITAWHKAGYTGKNIRMANMESTDPNLWFFDGKIIDHFKIGKEYNKNYHGTQTADVLHQVAPDADIYILPSGGQYGVDYAKGDFIEKAIPYMEENSICLVNASKGGTNNQILNQRILQAQKCGVTFATSAGNEDDSGASPFAKSGIWIAVAAVHLDSKGNIVKASYSSIDEEVDFTQFSGIEIHDARKGYEWRTFPVYGTSFSSPMLCGMLALVQQFFLERAGRTLKQDELYTFMKDYSIDLWEPGHDAKSGYGLFLLPENPNSIDIAKYIEKEELEINNPEYIIIHHSATLNGNAAIFRQSHKAKGWRDIGYHYIIGNGTNSGDGEVETGRPEWEEGAHCDSDGMNFKSIGICLVGNFDVQKPTTKQMTALINLCKDIMERHNIPISNVLGHKEVKGAATACPGKNFDMDAFRKRLEGGSLAKDYEGHWAQFYIEKAIAAGYMQGYPDGSFRPDDYITRAEFCRVLSFIIDRLEGR